MFNIIYKDYCFRLNLFSKMLRILLARNKRHCLFPIGSNFRVRIILHSVLKTLAGFCHSIGLYALTGSLGFRLSIFQNNQIIAFGSTFTLHFQIAFAILSFRQVIAFSSFGRCPHSTQNLQKKRNFLWFLWNLFQFPRVLVKVVSKVSMNIKSFFVFISL